MTRIILLIIISVISIYSYSYDFKVGNLYYTVTDATNLNCAVDKGDEVYSGDILIPSTVMFKNKELKVTSIINEAFDGSRITSIRFSDRMSYVERYTFYDCPLLTKVIIPSSIKKIGEGAFYNCPSLKILIFENGTSDVEFDTSYHEPFFQNSPIEEIYLGRNIKHFITEYKVFGDLSNLKKVEIGEDVTCIPSYCFAGATILERISIPGNVEVVREAAFNNCIGLKKVEICDSQNPIKMYQSTIGSPDYSGGIVNYSIFSQSPINEVYIGRDFSENSYYYYKNDITFEYLPITKVNIGKYVRELTSFYGCRDLSSIYIPSNVDSIKSFLGCSNLREVIVDNNIPPTSGRFSDETYVHGTLFVPKESISVFSSTSPWSSFWEIKDLSSASCEDIMYDEEHSGALYTINGICLLVSCSLDELENLPCGIYIWNGKKIRIK